MAVLPPTLVAGCFLVAASISLAVIIYIAWRGSKSSEFFSEALPDMYELELPDAEINMYYDMKDRLQTQVGAEFGADGVAAPWAHKLQADERLSLQQALMRRLVKDIERLDQVQKDKPGNWKMWRGKLITEHFWASLCDMERLVSEEVDSCLAEAEELEPGWRDHIFQQAVQFYRMDQQHQVEKKEVKKAAEKEKKNKVKEARAVITDVKKVEEDKIREEKAAEKAMEKLLREEENAAKKDKAKGKEKAAAKPKAKKK